MRGESSTGALGWSKVMWKVVAEILHRRLTTAITYHGFLHGFRAGRGTGTATLLGQAASASCGHEGGSPLRDLTGPDQGVLRLVQVKEPVYLGRLRGWATS